MNRRTQSSVSSQRQIFLWSGISAILIAAGYVAITVCFMIAGPNLPLEASEWVVYLKGKSAVWWAIIWLSVITDLLYLPVGLGLYELLKKDHRPAMLLCFALFALFVVLELSISWSKFPALIGLVERYHATDSAELKRLYLAAIQGLGMEFRTPVTSFYMIFIPSAAVIIASLASLQARVMPVAYPVIGLISGICNAVSSLGRYVYAPLEKLVILGSFLVLFWFLGAGFRLIRQSRTASEALGEQS